MSSITVRVGHEEKEISGLTRRTTCSDVLQALLKDKISLPTENGEAAKFDEIDISDPKTLKQLSHNYVIVETWRGCEKPLPPRTRILAVWQAWGKEQCYVTFSLKKSKHTRYRDSVQHHNSKEQIKDQCKFTTLPKAQCNQHAEAMQFLNNLSSGQKRRIRRSIMQYQRAVLNQRAQVGQNESGEADESGLDSAGVRFAKSGGRQTDNGRVTLSEEQFVDGVVTGPDCILQHNSKNKFIQSALDNKDLNSEYSTYRRRQIRRRSSLMLDDLDGLNEQNNILSSSDRKHAYSHYPYCPKSRRRSRSSSRRRRRTHKGGRGRIAKSSRRRGRHGTRCSTDDTTTSTGTTSTGSELDCDSHSAGEDADDEKSIKAEYGSTVRRKTTFLSPRGDSCSSGATTTSTTTTATDSSSATTTCSESSNSSGSSLSSTSSSETSGSTDYCERFFAKCATTPAPPAAAVTQVSKTTNSDKIKSTGGSKSAVRILRLVTGPSFSFKKKKKASQGAKCKTSSVELIKGVASDSSTPNNFKKSKEHSKLASTKSSILSKTSKAKAEDTARKNVEIKPHPDGEAGEYKIDEGSTNSVHEWKQIVRYRCNLLENNIKKLREANTEISHIETEIHRWRTRTHGKNYVQETYLSGLEPSTRSLGNSPNFSENSPTSSSLRPAQWLAECEDMEALSEFVDLSQKIVDLQIKIEENKRQSEIVLQDMQDEVWRASSDSAMAGGPLSPITAAASALGLVAHGNGDSSDDESAVESLSVHKKSQAASKPGIDQGKLAAAETTLELEKSNNELETNLYLSLRLSSELQEVDHRMETSQNLLQTKGEALISLVRELAESPEGISPDLWEEYGGLLVAYDEEVALQRQLTAVSELQGPSLEDDNIGGTGCSIPDLDSISQFFECNENDPLSPTASALHHALSPWLWCEHCKMELEQQQHEYSRSGPPGSLQWINQGTAPLCLSELPLPSPTSVRTPPSPSLAARSLAPLLPMPPIPDCNDSDYEELTDVIKNDKNATSAIISTKDAVPRGMLLRHSVPHHSDQLSQVAMATRLNYFPRSGSAGNPDDSGNASATSSLASTNSDGGSIDMGSRNGSCDGGSPRSTPCLSTESQDSGLSSPFLPSKSADRGSGKMFFFPSPKHNHNDEASKSGTRSSARSSPHRTAPAIPPKPKSMTAHGKVDTAQQGRLFSRNSGGRKRDAALNVGDLKQNNPLGRRATSFGKGRISAPALPNKMDVTKNKSALRSLHLENRKNDGQMKVIRSKTETDLKSLARKDFRYLPPLSILPSAPGMPSAPCSPFNVANKHAKSHSRDPRTHLLASETKRRVHSETYDNDSDTGLSSLHSADSDLMVCSETLV